VLIPLAVAGPGARANNRSANDTDYLRALFTYVIISGVLIRPLRYQRADVTYILNARNIGRADIVIRFRWKRFFTATSTLGGVTVTVFTIDIRCRSFDLGGTFDVSRVSFGCLVDDNIRADNVYVIRRVSCFARTVQKKTVERSNASPVRDD